MDIYSLYILFVIILKIIFITLSIYSIILRRKNETKTTKYLKVIYWKDRIEFIFIASMALLLIYLFNPYNKLNSNNKCIDNKTRILLFLFGIILIITAKWDLFFTTSRSFEDVQILL